MDDDFRTVVVEGLAGPGLGMQALYTLLPPRDDTRPGGPHMLCNPEVLFPDRLYPLFGLSTLTPL